MFGYFRVFSSLRAQSNIFKSDRKFIKNVTEKNIFQAFMLPSHYDNTIKKQV